jgi:cation transport ATPase
MATATALASRYGILPANPRVMAKIADIKTFVITRSTILAPDPALGTVLPISGITASYCLAVASALGENSPYYAGLFQDRGKNAGSSGYSVFMATDSLEGVAGTIDGAEALLGTEEFMLKNGIKTLLGEFKTKRLKHFYQAPLYVACNGILLGVIGITRAVPQYNRELLNRIAALGNN